MAKKKKKKAKRKAKPIVIGHLERVSSDIFELYKTEITKMILGNFGVYALYKRNKLYYIGLATNFKQRLTQHLRDRHSRKWDTFNLYIIRKQDHIREIEALLLRIADPAGNSQKGKLNHSENLLPELDQLVKHSQEQERKRLLGRKRTTKRKTKKKTTAKRKGKLPKGTKPLKGIFKKRTWVYSIHKGYEYRALVFPTGTIKYDGTLYDSPSAAGKAARGGKTTNGWSFWKYKDKNGNLIKLTEKRK